MHYPLSENFLRYFDVAFAGTKAQKSEVYGIRYNVYCEEFGYEPASAFPDHEEKDEFDEYLPPCAGDPQGLWPAGGVCATGKPYRGRMG